ncbi:hypothetical protein O8B93_20370 [Agrobacterium rhizogenes]|uniref:hypothetical protein n=1 Tax=Rhizobium rhizogenes TaxID=359 RepID=UPI0022B5EC5A|nr:hypothetical protein [Rhizobium rhizogenes]MCZ7449941.1 hypothetical protein [Rhizobium rhizogenes]
MDIPALAELSFRHSGLEPESSRRASARREESFQPKDLGWLDAGSTAVRFNFLDKVLFLAVFPRFGHELGMASSGE